MPSKVLNTTIPISMEFPEAFKEEYSIDIEDVYSLETGEHKGRIGGFTIFKSKDKQIDYAKITIGTRKKFSGKDLILEVDRVFLAEYHTESELIKLMDKLGAVEQHKLYPERLLNKPVRFTIKPNEKARPDSKYKEMVTNIELIDGLSDDIDFKYVKTFTTNGIEYTPVSIDAKEEVSPIQYSNPVTSNIILPDDTEDFLDFDN